MDVGQAVIASLEAIRQLLVVEAELVQQRSVQVMYCLLYTSPSPRD